MKPGDPLYTEGVRVAVRCQGASRVIQEARHGLSRPALHPPVTVVRHRPLMDAERSEIVRLREDGATIREIAARLHRRRDTVIEVLRTQRRAAA